MRLKQSNLRIIAVVVSVALVIGTFFVISLFVIEQPVDSVSRNLSDYWDFDTVQYNPDKGIYQHYYDQGIYANGNYVATATELARIKGMDHLYFRLPWVQVNPHEGEYDWSVLDATINLLCAFSQKTPIHNLSMQLQNG